MFELEKVLHPLASISHLLPILGDGVTHISAVKRTGPAAAPSPPARAQGVQSWNEVAIQPQDYGLRDPDQLV